MSPVWMDGQQHSNQRRGGDALQETKNPKRKRQRMNDTVASHQEKAGQTLFAGAADGAGQSVRLRR